MSLSAVALESMTAVASATSNMSLPSPGSVLGTPPDPGPGPTPSRHVNAVVGFMIGLGIVTLASIMNAAGLNLTKLDHVRTSAIPKADRRRDWLRPLWLLGMILYILSQLIGSTLALEYMRAEYVAPLGSTSLIFNFLFAKFLVNSPVTNHDIYGTIIVIIGVIGIVAFGSINSGLATETSAHHLTYLWTRGNWLGYFFFMSFALILLSIFTTQLDAVLAARADLNAAPFSSLSTPTRPVGRLSGRNILRRVAGLWDAAMFRVRYYLELWTAAHDDKRIAWTLGIGWACCGGGLAGGCLVFAKAAVKLISGSLSRENTGNQFGQASSIFTFILLAVTAVSQIICLNRGLKVYDSTLVVPVFYGVYTASGFLDSLIFNDEVDAYASWALFLIFCSILVLVSGVVLLTNKKPDQQPRTHKAGGAGAGATLLARMKRRRRAGKGGEGAGDEEEAVGLRGAADADATEDANGVLWELGEASEDEEDADASAPRRSEGGGGVGTGMGVAGGEGERARMIEDREDEDGEGEDGEDGHRASVSSDATLAHPAAYVDDFGDWGEGEGEGEGKKPAP